MTIRDELLALQNADGLIVPREVHDWAHAHPKSLLHQRLQWDDAEAGYQYRLNQIMHLIVLNITTADLKPEFVSLSIDRANGTGGGYRSIVDVVKVPHLREVMLDDALADLERVRRRYEYLKALAPVWKAVAGVKAKKRTKHGQKEVRLSM